MSEKENSSLEQKSTPRKHPHLFRKFVISSVIAIVVILSVVGVSIHRLYTMHIIGDAKATSLKVIYMLFEEEREVLISDDKLGLTQIYISSKHFSALDQRMQDLLRPLQIAKIKIFSKAKKVIYSTDYSIIGKFDKGNQNLIRSLEGEVIYEIKEKYSPPDIYGEEKFNVERLATYAPIKDEDGLIIGSFKLYLDVTSLRNKIRMVTFLSLALIFVVVVCVFGLLLILIWRRATREINNVYSPLHKSNEELRKQDQLKSHFISIASHEFKSPLVNISEPLAYLIRGKGGELNSEQKEILQLIKRNIDRLLRLVKDLLSISRIEEGKMKLEKEMVEVLSLYNEIVPICKKQMNEKHVAFIDDIDPNIGVIYADRDKITEVIINLLNNATKYTPEGGYVTIKLKGFDNDIRCEVSDNGPGITEKYREKIFDKFERISAERQEGTGLGLPIVKEIIGLHNGSIWVESEVGEGSKFIFLLPRNL